MENRHNNHGSYLNFFAMIATSMLAMFILMYSHSWEVYNHAWFSETRLFMTFIMGGAMMIIMLAYMLKMYDNRKVNTMIFIFAGLFIIFSVWLVRSQTTVADIDYMKGMIPHHSIAILTSNRATIEDPRVRHLADEIIEAQIKEIKEMEWLIEDIRTNGAAESQDEVNERPIPEFSGSME